MLTPEYLATCSDEILALYDALNTSIVEDVSRRIIKTGKITSTVKWQLKQMQEAGKTLDDAIEDISRITKYSDEYLRDLFEEAGVESIAYESKIYQAAGKEPISLSQSPAVQQVLEASIEKTKGNLNNLTLTTATSAQQMYLQCTNAAYMQVTSGAFTYQEAIKQAIKSAAEGGSLVYYASGRTSKLDVAIRRSIMTGVNQTAAKIAESYAADMGAEYYEVSAHFGARPTHQEWQGQVFQIKGSSARYRNFYDATGYGTGGGLCGYNCRHSFYPFFPGSSKRAYSKATLKDYATRTQTYVDSKGEEHTLTEYECTQKQRAYERKIRQSKTMLAGYDAAMKETSDSETASALKKAFTQESTKLKKTEAAMKDFCDQTNRRTDSARTQVYAVKDEKTGKIVAFNRSVSSKAVWANRKAK